MIMNKNVPRDAKGNPLVPIDQHGNPKTASMVEINERKEALREAKDEVFEDKSSRNPHIGM